MSREFVRLTFLALLVVPFPLVAANETVRLDSGLVSSALPLSDEVRVFKGIPFAAPPVGDLRWLPPQPPAHWSGVRKADQFGPECVQSHLSAANVTPGTREEGNEDCLYLNVWAPDRSSRQRLPVMVWIYGGGFTTGSSSFPFTDGDALARMGVLVVSFNYRLGVFGFFAHSTLTNEPQHTASGNCGLLDMIAALKWVQKNIAAFGGDPNRVTIFGESAGSLAVSYLMASPLGKGLFQRAIGESGSALTGPLGPRALAEAEQTAREFARFAKARSLAELGAIPADQMCKLSEAFAPKAGGPFTFWPYIDGSFLPAAPYSIFAEGKQNDVPLLAGSNAEDGEVVLSLLLHPIGPEEFVELARQRYGSQAIAYLQLYPASSSQQDMRADEIAGLTDEFFACPMRDWVRSQTKTGESKAYLYLFSRVPPAPGASEAFHAAEISYVFDSMNLHPDWAWTAVDRRLSQTMMSYWVNFARTGDPNGKGLPYWPAYNNQDQKVMHLGNTIEAGPEPDRRRLDWWDAWFAKQRSEVH